MNWTWLGIVALAVLAFSCYTGFRHGFVREVVSTFFVLLSIVVVWFINPYVNDFLRQNTPVYEKVQESCQELVKSKTDSTQDLGEAEQNEILDGLSLPAFLKEGITDNNTAEVYQYLAVDTFTEYVSGYLALMAVNGLSFFISFLLANLLIRMVTYALNIVSKLPIINGVNKLAGALMGGVKCVLFLWVAFLLLTVLCSTSIGSAGLELIENDWFLSFLYEHDIFVKIFMSIFYGK